MTSMFASSFVLSRSEAAETRICNDINGGYWVVQIEGTRMLAARTKNGETWERTCGAEQGHRDR